MFNSKWQLQGKSNPEYQTAAIYDNASNKRLENLGQTQQLLINSLLKQECWYSAQKIVV